MLTKNQKWILSAGLLFCLGGALSLILTDLILVPTHRLWFTKWPHFFISCTIPPMVFASFATYRWFEKGSKLFGGWANVSIAAWLALAINPLIWLLVGVTYILFGLVALVIFILCGVILWVSWESQNA